MKKFVAILLAVVAVGAIGTGGWVAVQHKDAIASMLPEREAPQRDPIFVRFDPIQVPVISGGSVSRLVTIEVVLQVDDTTVGDRVISQSPRLNDAYLSDLYGALHEGEGIENGVLNIAHVKRRLMMVSNSVLGDNSIRDVLVQMVGERQF